MQFPNPIVNQLVIYGADGNADVQIGPDPVITFYDGSFPTIQIGIFTGSSTPSMTIQNSLADSLTLELDPVNGYPRIEFKDHNSPFAEGEVYFQSIGGTYEFLHLGANFSGGIDAFMRMENDLANGNILVSAPVVAVEPGTSVVTESWHNMTVNSGTGVPSNFPQVKLLPDGTCIAWGVITGHSIVANALIATIDGNHLPARPMRFLAACEGTGTENILFLNTAGEIRIARGSSNSSWFTNLRYSMI